MSKPLVQRLKTALLEIISETNGISLNDSLELSMQSETVRTDPEVLVAIREFRELLLKFQINEVPIKLLLKHPVCLGLAEFFRDFPLPYQDVHTHLTGALSPEFVFKHLWPLLAGPNRDLYIKKIQSVYGPQAADIRSVEDVQKLITLKEEERFEKYLSILMLPKLLLTTREAHRLAAYSLAENLMNKFNVGFIRLKFSFSRATADEAENVPGLENLSSEDVVLGLYEGFKEFQRVQPKWRFVLAPSFRKEASFFDSRRFTSKRDHFLAQCEEILALIRKHPDLAEVMNEVDTVGNEIDLFRKSHFNDMRIGFRKLQYQGFRIRSHHGEVWRTLRRGIQSVDNAMNIWRIDTLEHGLALGINPNYYFHSMYQRILKWNSRSEAVRPKTVEFYELEEMDWGHKAFIRDKLLAGTPLSKDEVRTFTKTKFHMAREVESYQHDVLNRMIDKGVSLVALPSSNKKLTAFIEDYKDHPFSWWEKKGLELGIGTDNYVTLDTNFIRELLILLLTDANDLKITKLLMVATGESRRAYISSLLWEMRRKTEA
jgi:adenosine deaminase